VPHDKLKQMLLVDLGEELLLYSENYL